MSGGTYSNPVYNPRGLRDVSPVPARGHTPVGFASPPPRDSSGPGPIGPVLSDSVPAGCACGGHPYPAIAFQETRSGDPRPQRGGEAVAVVLHAFLVSIGFSAGLALIAVCLYLLRPLIIQPVPDSSQGDLQRIEAQQKQILERLDNLPFSGGKGARR